MTKKKTILVVDDDASIRESFEKILKRTGYEVLTAENGEEALDIIRQQSVDLVLSDLRMPKMGGLKLLKASKTLSPEIEVILMTAFGDVDAAVEAMQDGAYHFIQKPLKRSVILMTIARALEKRTLVLENQSYRRLLKAEFHFGNIIGESLAMRGLIAKIQQVAPSGASILILGESGTGKEVIANALHTASSQADKPLIKVSCAALPETLMESELFGYEKGAFTGANGRKLGRFELANDGTIFLDEIGDMPTHLQVKLLRVLQEGEFERLGATKSVRVNVRLISATNKDLVEEVQEGRFRQDLFYRLNVITLEIPPLRNRREDILLLANHFLDKYNQKYNKSIQGVSREAISSLETHNWPGNVRELESAIEQAVILSQSNLINLTDLPETSRQDKITSQSSITIPLGSPMKKIEEQVISETLKMTKGNKELAAKLLGISSRTIYRKLN